MADMMIGFLMDRLAQAAWNQHIRCVACSFESVLHPAQRLFPLIIGLLRAHVKAPLTPVFPTPASPWPLRSSRRTLLTCHHYVDVCVKQCLSIVPRGWRGGGVPRRLECCPCSRTLLRQEENLAKPRRAVEGRLGRDTPPSSPYRLADDRCRVSRVVQGIQGMAKLEVPDQVVDLPLPRRLFEGNAGTFTTQCIMEDSLAGYVANNSVCPTFRGRCGYALDARHMGGGGELMELVVAERNKVRGYEKAF